MRSGITGSSWNAEKNVPNWKSHSERKRGVKSGSRDTGGRVQEDDASAFLASMSVDGRWGAADGIVECPSFPARYRRVMKIKRAAKYGFCSGVRIADLKVKRFA